MRIILSSLHHAGLIKILLCHELEKQKDSLSAFLERNQIGLSDILSPKEDSPRQADPKERLSDEDNIPLSQLFQKYTQAKGVMKPGIVKTI